MNVEPAGMCSRVREELQVRHIPRPWSACISGDMLLGGCQCSHILSSGLASSQEGNPLAWATVPAAG